MIVCMCVCVGGGGHRGAGACAQGQDKAHLCQAFVSRPPALVSAEQTYIR